jgi:hypothetical protein
VQEFLNYVARSAFIGKAMSFFSSAVIILWLSTKSKEELKEKKKVEFKLDDLKQIV